MNNIKNTLITTAALMGGIIPVGAVIWQVSGAVKDSVTKIESLEARLYNLESVSPDTKGSDIARRLSQAESSVNQMNKELGKLKANMGRVENNASGLGEGLAERVNTLEKEAKNFSEENNNQDNSALLSRITKIEKEIKELLKRPLGHSNSMTGSFNIDTDFSSTLETKTVGDMELSLLNCERISKLITCSFIGTNIGENNEFYFYANANNSNNESKAFLPSGVHKVAKNISIGGIIDKRTVKYNFPKNIPIKVEYSFSDIPTDVKGFLLLQIKSNNNDVFEFEKVSIVE